MERILSSNAGINTYRTEQGVWNFFKNRLVKKDDGRITTERNGTFSFELKGYYTQAICCNFCWDILEDALGAQWDDEFAKVQERTIRTTVFSTHKPIETDLKVAKIGTVTTPAGSFDDCLELSLNIKVSGGHFYRGGKKEYYFAPGVGIIKAVHHFDNDSDAIYELCEYEGVGEGYFPAEDGLRRFYKATNLPEGDRASVEYTFVTGDDGELYMLSDQLGMRAVK